VNKCSRGLRVYRWHEDGRGDKRWIRTLHGSRYQMMMCAIEFCLIRWHPVKKEEVCLNKYIRNSEFIDTGSGVRRSRGRPRGPSARSALKVYRVLSKGPTWFDRLVRETELARNTVWRTLGHLLFRGLVSKSKSGRRVVYEIREDEVDEPPLRAIAWAELISRPQSRAERRRRDEFFEQLVALWSSPEGKELRSLNPRVFRLSLSRAIRQVRPPFEIVKRMRGELDVQQYEKGLINAILWDTRGKAYWTRTAVEAPEHDYERPRRVQYVSRRSGKKRTRFVYEPP